MRGNCIVTLGALALFACQTPGERVAGTSTSVGTSVGGTALTQSGKPAVGARITLRSQAVSIRNGKPEGTLFSEAVADSQGRFSFRAPSALYTLRITCGAACGMEAERETWMAEFQGAPAGGALREVRLEPPGVLKGNLAPVDGKEVPDLWIGIPGTDLYVRPDPAGTQGRAFALKDVPAGEYFLEVVAPQDTGLGMQLKTKPITVRSSATTDLGRLP